MWLVATVLNEQYKCSAQLTQKLKKLRKLVGIAYSFCLEQFYKRREEKVSRDQIFS